jgi:glycosyltransferase involved in cell wall biosynthesis
MKLSLCMVLKNEGTTIRKCLESVLAAKVVDEWIIGIDDKTTDNTREEVSAFFAQSGTIGNVYEYTWADSFSDARNIGMDKATGDYILIMDGHEFIPDDWYVITENKRLNSQEVLRSIKDRLDLATMDSIFLCLYQQPFTGETPNNFFMQPRIYRNGAGANGKMIRYGRAAHNVIQNTDRDKEVHFPECIVIHDAPESNRTERQTQRLVMNEAQLNADLEKNPNDIRAMFYMGNTLMEGKRWQEAIDWFTKYLDVNKTYHNERYQALIHKALCLREIGKENECFECLYLALSVSPDRRDAYQIIGDMYLKNENWDKAIQSYSQLLQIPPKPTRMFTNGPASTFMPHQQIARAYVGAGKPREAIAHFKAAYSFVPHQGWKDEIQKLHGKLGIYIVDAFGSFTGPIIERLKSRGHDVVVTKEYNRTLAMWADRIFVEWGDENAAQIDQLSKTAVRVHGYEAYLKADIVNKIPCQIVFVAQHILDYLGKHNPGLYGRSRVIPNGVDCAKFTDRGTDRDAVSVGLAGFLNSKKNPLRLAKIIKANPHKVFHLRVDWQDPMLKAAFEYETAKCKNIVYHARYENLADFWNQMQFVISTSDIESFSFNVAEAMACGCTPVIYDWNGARQTWGDEWVFTDMPKFKVADRKLVRQFILDHYEQETMLNDLERVIYGK